VAEDPFKNVPGAGAARFVGAVMGFVFAGIGLTVLVFMWGAPFDEFGSPPLFFRIFASFIAIAFVGMGGTMGVSALRGGFAKPGETLRRASPDAPPAAPAGYKCPNCGAPLGEQADVSPSGDVKCTFCGRWFNVHRPA
jgi:DNA-directed RNA polymerase subunit RPC12/RpoP